MLLKQSHNYDRLNLVMEDNLIKTFLELCRIPSPSGSEKNIREYILKRLKGFINSQYIDSTGNLFLTVKGSINKTLLLCAHMDTVGPTGKQEPIIKNDIISGNGTNILGADNKAGLAVIIELLILLKEEKILHPNLEILFTVKEETEGGIQKFPKEKITATHCVMSDLSAPIGDTLTVAPFVSGYGIRVEGKSAHVKTFTKDTFHPLQYFLDFTAKIPLGRISQDTIVNIGILKMGENYNNIPKDIYFTGEIRTFSDKIHDSFLKKLHQTVTELDSKYKTKTYLEIFPYCKGFTLKEKDLITIKEIYKSLGLKYHPIQTFSVGDVNILNGWGITTINIADGSVDCHTLNEHISTKDIKKLFLIEKLYITTYN